MASVNLDKVKKIYAGGVEAVKGVSLGIADGSFTVLLGPSGCGKSTLLRMIAGLEHISEGTIAIGPRVVNEIEPSERDIAMVFQNYALYPHMSVYDNMAYGLRNRGTPQPEIEKRVAEAARMLAIEPFLQRKPRALSGGQRQRVAMGRAIVREPAVFLFDEPLSNLDAKLRVQMRLEIRKLHNRLRATSIFVTHDQVEAMTLADQVVVMNVGRIEQTGTPLEIYRRPASKFVATFIGSPAMNLFSGTVTSPDEVTLADGTRLRFEAAAFAPGRGAKVDIGLRPEEAKVDAAPSSSTPRLNWDVTEELGATRLLHGTLAGEPFVLALPSDAIDPGRDIAISALPSNVHLFDPASGRSLRRV
ncbi:MAG: sn-glycerol-3-phosphate ABC transporter ATP-binding protein UgpC [Alphaproteobacteria bacterium]|nr:sn-glycerol-3-phosphate ABC transporter ATP-binding protein UgpC [Alphaproteobacteria bacterium]